MRVTMSTVIRAPRDRVFAIYANYRDWPKIFPTIKGVRLVRDDGDVKLLEIDHREGLVPNTLRLRPPDVIAVDEIKRRYTGTFTNTFEVAPGGTRYTVAADTHLKGGYKLATPLVAGYVRHQLVTLVLDPIKQCAEGRS